MDAGRRYGHIMASSKRARLLVVLWSLAALGSAPALAASSSSGDAIAAVKARALLTSRELWATVDVCSPSDQPNTVGVRGSMPGDGKAGEKMFMSFRLQYLNAARTWVDLLGSASPSFVSVGGASTARQGGRSFQLVPVAGKPAVTLRGVVDFQWRRGGTVLLSTSRASTVGHKSLAGADPAGFSAATCLIG